MDDLIELLTLLGLVAVGVLISLPLLILILGLL
jgi:hypothetical protein